MRTKFNLDIQPLDGYTYMIHGDRGSGKTHMLGDMLRVEKQHGKVLYINVDGEDGMRTISGLGLGDCAETITTYDDLLEIITECAKDKYQAIGLDSYQMFAKLAMFKVTKADRLPIIPSREQMNMGMQNEWPEVHRLMEAAAIKLRKAARYVGVTCASDKSISNLDMADRPKLTLIAPNLPGKEAGDSAGWFDFMGYIDLRPTKPGEFKRTFSMVPDGITKVRQRVPKLIRVPLVLPEGQGVWTVTKEAIEKASV